MKKYYRYVILVVVTIIVLWIMLHAVKPKDLWQLLHHFPFLTLVALCGLSMVISILKTIRFMILLRYNGVQVTFWQTLKVYFAGQATTPLPGGEAMRAVLLEKEVGAKMAKTSGPVITQAFLEFFSAALLTIGGSLFYGVLRRPAIVIALLLVIIIVFLSQRTIFAAVVTKLNAIPKLRKATKQLLIMQHSIEQNVRTKERSYIPNMAFVAALIIALAAHLVGGLMIFLIARSFQVPLPVFRSIFIYCASIVISALSGIVPAGVGATEGGMAGIMALSDIGLPQIFAIIVIFRFITVVFYIAVGGITFSLFYGKRMVKKESHASKRK